MAQNGDAIVRDQLLSALGVYTDADFVEVDAFEDLVNDAYFESHQWMSAVLGEKNSPHAEANAAKHSYHLWKGEQPGFDLLRHEYELGGRAIVVTESVPIIHISIRLNPKDLKKKVQPQERATEVGNQVMYRPGGFQPAEGSLLSTNPALEVSRVKDWRDRVDAIVSEDRVQLIVYKQDPMASPAPRNLTVWFDAEFREDPPRKKKP